MGLDVLIVDDSVVARAFVAKTLGAANLELGDVEQAQNGKEALDRLGSRSFDVVMTDINMPEMNGVELVEKMAEQGLLGATKVVVVSTEKNEERIAKLRSHGIDKYLRKPFGPSDLRDVLVQLQLV